MDEQAAPMSTAVSLASLPTRASAATDLFRPSEYTGLLMHALRSRSAEFGRAKGLDMGMGSGVLLATLGLLGVEALYGVDIDPAAVETAGRLIDEMGLSQRATLRQGSLWEPLGDERFDVVVANLPNFAASVPSDPSHSRFWSMGGASGRLLIDPFVAGLRAHLKDDGVAFMTHNVFANIAKTYEVLARNGMSVQVIMATTVVLNPTKSALLDSGVRARFSGDAITRFGSYEFADVQVLEIRPLRS